MKDMKNDALILIIVALTALAAITLMGDMASDEQSTDPQREQR